MQNKWVFKIGRFFFCKNGTFGIIKRTFLPARSLQQHCIDCPLKYYQQQYSVEHRLSLPGGKFRVVRVKIVTPFVPLLPFPARRHGTESSSGEDAANYPQVTHDYGRPSGASGAVKRLPASVKSTVIHRQQARVPPPLQRSSVPASPRGTTFSQHVNSVSEKVSSRSASSPGCVVGE